MTLDEIRTLRKELRLTLKELSERSGVPLPTVQKIISGSTASPRYKTLRALEKAIAEAQGEAEKDSRRNDGFRYPAYSAELPLAAETARIYHAAPEAGGKCPGEYTLKDYLALPEDHRVELIDGVFYEMLAPNYAHQLIAGEILNQLKTFIRSRGGPCLPFIAPADVQLDCDDKTIVQPDVFVVCDRSRIRLERLYGAPDLVIEVLSPSTRKKDMRLKWRKYEAAGVKEYWIVDPEKRHVIVFLFDEEEPDIIYADFHSKVPVGIFNNECLIDFEQVWVEIAFLYAQEE